MVRAVWGLIGLTTSCLVAQVARSEVEEQLCLLQASAVAHAGPERMMGDRELGGSGAAHDDTRAGARLLVAVPSLPVKAGCYVWAPSGCPKHPLYKASTWVHDEYGETSLGAGVNKTVCMQERKPYMSRWCGTIDIEVLFIPKADETNGESDPEELRKRLAWEVAASRSFKDKVRRAVTQARQLPMVTGDDLPIPHYENWTRHRKDEWVEAKRAIAEEAQKEVRQEAERQERRQRRKRRQSAASIRAARQASEETARKAVDETLDKWRNALDTYARAMHTEAAKALRTEEKPAETGITRVKKHEDAARRLPRAKGQQAPALLEAPDCYIKVSETTEGENGCMSTSGSFTNVGKVDQVVLCAWRCFSVGLPTFQYHESKWCTCFRSCDLLRPAITFSSPATVFRFSSCDEAEAAEGLEQQVDRAADAMEDEVVAVYDEVAERVRRADSPLAAPPPPPPPPPPPRDHMREEAAAAHRTQLASDLAEFEDLPL